MVGDLEDRFRLHTFRTSFSLVTGGLEVVKILLQEGPDLDNFPGKFA